MANELEKSGNIQEVYEGVPPKALKEAGYKLDGLSEAERSKQLQEAISLHEHLRDIETGGEPKLVPPAELEGVELPDQIRSAEEQAEYRKCLTAAQNILEMFDLKPDEEDFLIVTDNKVMKVNPQMIEAVIEKAKEVMGSNFRVMVAPESKKSATPLGETIGERMAGRPVLIMTSRSRSHSPETSAAISQEQALAERAAAEWDKIIQTEKFNEVVVRGWTGIEPDRLEQIKSDGIEQAIDLEKYKELCRKRNSRVVSITKGHNPGGILTEGGALEKMSEIQERGEKVNELMKEVEKVHITSAKGTDLWLYPMVRNQDLEDGKIDEPGKLSNFPVGEWPCSVQLQGTSGTLVIDGPCGGGLDRHLIGAGVKLEIKDGLIEKIEGVEHEKGRSILKKIPEKDNQAALELLEKIDGGDLDKVFEAITKEDLPEIWESLAPDEQVALKSYLAAVRLRSYLELGNRDYQRKNPEDKKADAFKLAEFAVGTNKKAVAPYNTRSTDGEKEYGTTHIAAGRNASFGVPQDDINYNDIEIHCDMVHDNPTIECYKKGGETFKLIEKGRPIGY